MFPARMLQQRGLASDHPHPSGDGNNPVKADAYDPAGVLNARVCTTITRTGP
jgi:hypothetical protein